MISIVFPVYNEQDNIQALYARLVSTIEKIEGEDFEIVFVDDCSTDKTQEIILQLTKTDKRVQTIRFSRNFGSHSAVAAGVTLCRGDAAILLAADLQDPPEIIPHLMDHWRKGLKVVWGVREKRIGESLFSRALSRTFFFLMNRLTDLQLPPTGADVFLIDRTVIEALKNSPEKNVSIFMLIAWLGFPQIRIMYAKEERHAGSSKWSFSQRLKIFFDSLISFSYVPLRVMSLMGGFFALIGLLYGTVIFIRALKGIPILGWSSMMVVILLFSGFQMSMMGMLGEYLWRTYDESRSRPRYVIEKNTLLENTSRRNLKMTVADTDAGGSSE